MRTIFTFWSFAPFTWMERLCLASWVAAGHPVDLYAYEEIPDLPAGVTLKDASAIVPQQQAVMNEKVRSYSLFGDVFRYEGLQRGLGIWCDADVLLLRSLDDLGDHIYGWERSDSICNAVLHMPPAEPFLAQMLEVARSPVPVLPYWPTSRKIKQRLRGLLGRPRPLSAMSHTSIGPRALTHYVRKNRLYALPQEVLYPLPVQYAVLSFIPGVPVESYIAPETRTIHLWNTEVRELKRSPPPPGSFMARMCEKYLSAPAKLVARS